jgi:azurin
MTELKISMKNPRFAFSLRWIARRMPLLICGSAAFAAEPHVHHEAPVQEVRLGTIHGQMKFDTELFTVSPGAKVKLMFSNSDEMQHNVVICQPGENVGLEVAQKAWALGADAMAKQFIPDDPRVLFFSKVLEPEQSDTVTFDAPAKEGDYPYVCTLPGHATQMHGIMRVGNPASGLRELSYAYYEGNWSMLPDFSALTPQETGRLPKNVIDLAVAKKADFYAMVFTATLDVPADGNYTFYLNSDDGSRLFLDEIPVVTYDGVHPAKAAVSGSLRLDKGAHHFRLQYFEKDHGQQLDVEWEGPGLKRTWLSPKPVVKEAASPYHLKATTEPLVIRSFLDNGPPRAISVALPGGPNYCFDAGTCSVVFGWTGEFLDVKPDRGGDISSRGGGWSKVLGERFAVGDLGFPLRFGEDGGKQEVRFGGYRRRHDGPEFLMTSGGVEIRQTIRPAAQGKGLQYDFVLSQSPGDVVFEVNPAGLELSSSAGTWTGGVLKVPAADAGKFSVTVRPR